MGYAGSGQGANRQYDSARGGHGNEGGASKHRIPRHLRGRRRDQTVGRASRVDRPSTGANRPAVRAGSAAARDAAPEPAGQSADCSRGRPDGVAGSTSRPALPVTANPVVRDACRYVPPTVGDLPAAGSGSAERIDAKDVGVANRRIGSGRRRGEGFGAAETAAGATMAAAKRAATTQRRFKWGSGLAGRALKGTMDSDGGGEWSETSTRGGRWIERMRTRSETRKSASG